MFGKHLSYSYVQQELLCEVHVFTSIKEVFSEHLLVLTVPES